MSEPKFTKGPWDVAQQIDPQRDHDLEIRDSRGQVLAFVVIPDGGDVVSEEEAEANADIMGAAPDLYAALERCITHLEREITEGYRHDGLCHDDAVLLAEQDVEEYRAALAKARGEVSDA
jgi:hypothetical protein